MNDIILYGLFATPCADDCFERKGADGLLDETDEEFSDFAYEVSEVRVGDRDSVLNAMHLTEQYGNYRLLDKTEYDKLK